MSGERSGYIVAGFAGVILAAIVHIVAVLAAPQLASRNAATRLANREQPERSVLLARAAPGKVAFPFQDPAVSIAVCGFDLAVAPVRVRMPVGLLVTTVSLHGADGRAFYAITDRAAREGAVEIVVMTRGQLDEAIRQDDEDEPTGDVRVLAPDLRGIAVARVVSRQPSDRADADEAAAALSCKAEVDEEVKE
jgi:uncharacterized membrane protein